VIITEPLRLKILWGSGHQWVKHIEIISWGLLETEQDIRDLG
jgi:hypothetical protein